MKVIKAFLEKLEVAIPSSKETHHRIYLDDDNGDLMIDLFLADGKFVPTRLKEEDLKKGTGCFIKELKTKAIDQLGEARSEGDNNLISEHPDKDFKGIYYNNDAHHLNPDLSSYASMWCGGCGWSAMNIYKDTNGSLVVRCIRCNSLSIITCGVPKLDIGWVEDNGASEGVLCEH